MTNVAQNRGRVQLVATAMALMLSQAGCSGALWGNFLIVLLALAIFVGTIRLGGKDDEKPDR